MAEVLQIVRRLQEEAGHKKRIGTGTKKRNLPISLSKLLLLPEHCLLIDSLVNILVQKSTPALKTTLPFPYLYLL